MKTNKTQWQVHLPVRVRRFILEGKQAVSAGELAERFGISSATAGIYLNRAAALGLGTKIAPKEIAPLPRDLPKPSPEKQRVVSAVRDQLPFAELSVWSAQDLNEYAHNVITSRLVVVETRGKAAEAVKEALAAKGIKAVAYSAKSSAKAALELLEEPVLVVDREDGMGTTPDSGDRLLRNPTYEKIFVDAYFLSTRKKIGTPASEVAAALANVYAFKRALRLSLLMTVAKRRHVDKEFRSLFSELKKRHPEYPIPRAYSQKTRLTRRQAKFLADAIGGLV